MGLRLRLVILDFSWAYLPLSQHTRILHSSLSVLLCTFPSLSAWLSSVCTGMKRGYVEFPHHSTLVFNRYSVDLKKNLFPHTFHMVWVKVKFLIFFIMPVKTDCRKMSQLYRISKIYSFINLCLVHALYFQFKSFPEIFTSRAIFWWILEIRLSLQKGL